MADLKPFAPAAIIVLKRNLLTGAVCAGDETATVIFSEINRPAADGEVVETLMTDFSVSYAVVRNGSLKPFTLKAAMRSAIDRDLGRLAGRQITDPITVANWRAVYAGCVVESLIERDAECVLQGSINGVTVTVTHVANTIAIGRKKIKVGEYRGRHKGFPIKGLQYDIRCDLVAARQALTVLRDLDYDGILVLSVALTTHRGILEVHGVKSARGGAVRVDGYLALNPVDETAGHVFSTTRQGLHAKVANIIAIDLAEKKQESEYQEARLRDQQARERRAEIDAARRDPENAGILDLVL